MAAGPLIELRWKLYSAAQPKVVYILWTILSRKIIERCLSGKMDGGDLFSFWWSPVVW